MVAPVIPAINDAEIERILDAAALAGVRNAGFVMLRLPLEVRDLFREWVTANFPDRAERVFKLIREMRGGKDYDAQWGTRMKGTGPYAWMIGRRFETACEKLGLNRDKHAARRPTVFGRRWAVEAAQSVRIVSAATPAACRLVTIGVRDMAASARFYGALGFVRKVRATGRFSFFEAGGVVLALWDEALLADDAGLPPEAAATRFGGVTLALNCATPAEVDAVLARALEAGAKSLREAGATDYGGYRGYFVDPDGHVWEAVHAPGIRARTGRSPAAAGLRLRRLPEAPDLARLPAARFAVLRCPHQFAPHRQRLALPR